MGPFMALPRACTVQAWWMVERGGVRMTPAGRAPTPDCHYYYYYEEEEEKAEEEESVEGMKEAWACLKPHSLAMAVLKTILEQM